MLTTDEKAKAYDNLVEALTNCWWDGRWSWWCNYIPGGVMRLTQVEAIKDLVEWASNEATRKRRNKNRRTALKVVSQPTRDTTDPNG